MPHYDPSLHTTADVVRQVIIPMTQGPSSLDLGELDLWLQV